MNWFVTFSVFYTFFFLVCPLAYYIGFYGMALIDHAPNIFAVWINNRRILRASDHVIAEYWQVTMQRKVAN